MLVGFFNRSVTKCRQFAR